ncbi:MAG: potassium-transporting ATPase subunit KdpB [Candidatus Gastranaerophilaceae bacterium]
MKSSIFKAEFLIEAITGSFLKLNPVDMVRNPVMFVVEIGSAVTTAITIYNIIKGQPFSFDLQISLWLWFTVLFANFAEALAEGKGKAQAEAMKKSRSETFANVIQGNGELKTMPALSLQKGDIVLVKDNEDIPCDGEIVDGVALVDESAITGESAPVVRESGGDRSAVTGGTKVLSGSIKVRITANPGETFLDRMIKMVEGAKRQKTPNEKALEILLIGLTVLFLVVVITLKFFAGYMGVNVAIPILIALLVCLMPTTIGGLLPAIGIAGMDRLLTHNVIALSGRAVEASGDVNIVLLDKTGTITLGNRLATEFIPANGVDEKDLAHAAMLSSLADDTPEGRSVVVLAKEKLHVRGRDIKAPHGAKFIEFSAETRMSGIDVEDNLTKREIRKGAVDAISNLAKSHGLEFPAEVLSAVELVAGQGGTPLVVAENGKVLGVIRLKDVLKQGIKERLHQLHLMGIKSVMITGDNQMTAAAIAAEAGVSDFVAEAKPETKLGKIRDYQNGGYMVAMIGDGTNDAPALAQADVAVAMNAGTQAAREASNMIDLDSSPTKLLDIVEIGKQILITRGALTTFSVANDVSKYFAIIPALFVAQFPALKILNIMQLASPQSAILSAVIFNAIVIPCLIPLSLRGVKYKQTDVETMLKKNIFIYGFGGLLLPFVAIKLIDILVVLLRLNG